LRGGEERQRIQPTRAKLLCTGWQLLPCSCGKATAHTSYPLDVSGGERGATAVSREGYPGSEGRANLPCPTRHRRERRHNPSSPGVSAPAPTAASRSACVTGMLSIVQVSAHGLFPLRVLAVSAPTVCQPLLWVSKVSGLSGCDIPRGLDFSGLTASSKCGPGNRARTRANAGRSCRGHGLRWEGGVPRRTRRGPILVRASIRTPAHGFGPPGQPGQGASAVSAVVTATGAAPPSRDRQHTTHAL